MSDAISRLAARRAQATGCLEDKAREILADVRAGRMRSAYVEIAAYCGSKPARVALGREASPFRCLPGLAEMGDEQARREWAEGFRAFGLDPFAWAVFYTLRAMWFATDRGDGQETVALDGVADRPIWWGCSQAIEDYLKTGGRRKADRKAFSAAILHASQGHRLENSLLRALDEIHTSLGSLRPPSLAPLLTMADILANAGAWHHVPKALASHFLGDPPRKWWEVPPPAIRAGDLLAVDERGSVGPGNADWVGIAIPPPESMNGYADQSGGSDYP